MRDTHMPERSILVSTIFIVPLNLVQLTSKSACGSIPTGVTAAWPSLPLVITVKMMAPATCTASTVPYNVGAIVGRCVPARVPGKPADGKSQDEKYAYLVLGNKCAHGANPIFHGVPLKIPVPGRC
jgi:hypothetical protein